jgi:membrane protein YqaA with SNARE-associated domain
MGGALVFASASVGLPPFYIMSVAAGAARMNLAWFIVLGSLGRLIRFGVIVAVPQFVKGGFHF